MYENPGGTLLLSPVADAHVMKDLLLFLLSEPAHAREGCGAAAQD